MPFLSPSVGISRRVSRTRPQPAAAGPSRPVGAVPPRRSHQPSSPRASGTRRPTSHVPGEEGPRTRPRAAAAPLTSRPILLPEAGARGGSRPALTPAASPRPPAGRTVALQHQALTPDTANYLGGERGLRRRDEKGFETRRRSWTMPGAPARRTGRALRPGSRVGRPALGSGTGAVRRAGVGRGRQRWWEDTGPRLGSSEPHRRHLARRVTPSRGVSCRPPVAA